MNHIGMNGVTPSARRLHQGVSLIELLVCICVAAIVVAFATMFISTPIQAYFAQTRRAELVSTADLITRNMDGDLRHALPNSVRITSTGQVIAIEMLAISSVASYRDSGSSGNATQKLAVGSVDAQFDVFAPFTDMGVPFNSNGQRLAVNNLGTPGLDAYTQSTVMTPVTTSLQITASATPNEDHVVLSNGFKFVQDSPTHHVFLVSGPVTYLCDIKARTLTRYWNYTIASNQSARNTATKLINAGAKAASIASSVASCKFDYQLGNVQHDRLVGIQLSLTQSGESLPVFMQLPIENTL